MANEKNGIKALTEKDLENVSGGFVYQNPNGGDTPFELIDDMDGSVLGRFSSEHDCRNSAKLNGLNTRSITTDELNKIRGRI